MLQSQLFTKTRKEIPAGEVARNAELLIRAGFIYKEMAGVYAYLPLGLRVLKKIEQIIREEMNSIGGQEVVLTSLQDKVIWEKSNRWSDTIVDNWFKTTLKNGAEIGLGFTHEEPVTKLMKDFINSYRDLPRFVYQFQTKFRNETRAKSGIMRTREFVMKDLYSFSKNKEQHDIFYEKAKQAYMKIFDRVGLGDQTYLTFASGGVFSEYSHEFQTLTTAGEDIIYVDEDKKIAVNKEVYTDEVLANLGLDRTNLVEKKAVEVGNIFTLGTRFADVFELTYLDEAGSSQSVFMGSYGIGPGRLMGTVVELFSDEQGIAWPKNVAPFDLHLVSLCREESDQQKVFEVYKGLQQAGYDVLFDDRDVRAGEKFADSDLIGIPVRVVISPKTLANNSVEIKLRVAGQETEAKIVPLAELKTSI